MPELKMDTARALLGDPLTVITRNLPANILEGLEAELTKLTTESDRTRFLHAFTCGYIQGQPDFPVIVSALVKNKDGVQRHETFSLPPGTCSENEIILRDLVTGQIVEYNQIHPDDEIQFLSIVDVVSRWEKRKSFLLED